MHSDGAAALHAGLGAAPQVGARVDAACAAERPSEALRRLARALRDEGVGPSKTLSLLAARALNAAGQSRVTLSLR